MSAGRGGMGGPAPHPDRFGCLHVERSILAEDHAVIASCGLRADVAVEHVLDDLLDRSLFRIAVAAAARTDGDERVAGARPRVRHLRRQRRRLALARADLEVGGEAVAAAEEAPRPVLVAFA